VRPVALLDLRSKMRPSPILEIPQDSGAFWVGRVGRCRRILSLLIGQVPHADLYALESDVADLNRDDRAFF
jgi:hypothetical protein